MPGLNNNSLKLFHNPWGRCGPRSGYSTSPIACIANPTSAGYDAIGRRSPRLRTGGGGKGSTVTPTATATRTIGGGTSLTAVARTSTCRPGATSTSSVRQRITYSSGGCWIGTASGRTSFDTGSTRVSFPFLSPPSFFFFLLLLLRFFSSPDRSFTQSADGEGVGGNHVPSSELSDALAGKAHSRVENDALYL